MRSVHDRMTTMAAVRIAGVVIGAISPVPACADAAGSAMAPTRPADLPLPSWSFGTAVRWGGWEAGGQITNIRFESDCVTFDTTGGDPMIIGPVFPVTRATNRQWVEIDIACDAPGDGELYFASGTTGPDGGFQAKWFVPVAVPDAGRRIVSIWPFWERLGQVARLRFDPPTGTRCRLYKIRIVDDPAVPGSAMSPWRSMYAARLEPSASGIRVCAERAMAVVVASVEPFPAASRSILHLDVDCPDEDAVCLYWATREETGLWGEPIGLPAHQGRPITLDLRQSAAWKGTITHLAVGFGTRGGEVLTLRSLRIDENAPGVPFLRLRHLGYAPGPARPGRPADLRIILEHAAGPAIPAGQALLETDANVSCPDPRLVHPAMKPGDRVELHTSIIPHTAGQAHVTFSIAGQRFGQTLRIEPAVGEPARGLYDVPAPRPVKSEYQVGVYYYPGWSDPEMRGWKRQADLPERDPLLGWYAEGSPVVADWHIKWALENGISFFVYDWYWRDGREQLGAALNDGFLKARYGERMQFAVMWANHKPFSNHTPAQLLAVTDYWIEHYLRRPNYLRVEGRPYVSFYSPVELLSDPGSSGAVRSALESMRQRARAAGLPDLHIGAVDIAGQVDLRVLEEAGFDSLTSYTYIRTIPTPAAHMLYAPWVNGFEARWERASREPGLPYIPVLAAGWDGPEWYGPRSERRRGRRPEHFEAALGRLKAFLGKTGGKIAMLEAWNEWGEGAYLEPNVGFGFDDLEAIRRTFGRPGEWPVNIAPADVGLAGRYDQRKRIVTSGPGGP